MSKRKYARVVVAQRVRCMSDGHHWFAVSLFYGENVTDGWVSRAYSPGYGFEGLSNALGWNAPKYVTDMVNREIGQMCRDNKFVVFEHDRDGNKRYDDLRYHDPDVFKWYGEQYK